VHGTVGGCERRDDHLHRARVAVLLAGTSARPRAARLRGLLTAVVTPNGSVVALLPMAAVIAIRLEIAPSRLLILIGIPVGPGWPV